MERLDADELPSGIGQHRCEVFVMLLMLLTPACIQSDRFVELERFCGGGRQQRCLNHHHSPDGVLCIGSRKGARCQRSMTDEVGGR